MASTFMVGAIAGLGVVVHLKALHLCTGQAIMVQVRLDAADQVGLRSTGLGS